MSSPHTAPAALLRGGRLRKTSRGVLTFAPFLATASAVALGALLSLTSPQSALAGTCTGSAGTYTCSGAADSASDTTQTLRAESGQRLTVTQETGADFGLNPSSGDAFSLTAASGSSGLEINIAGPITTTGTGIGANHLGSGAAGVTAAAITANSYGINAVGGSSTSDLTITANGNIMAGDQGIRANHSGDGSVSITANAAVTSRREHGIRATTTSTGTGLTINAAGAIMATTTAKHGILADHDGSGAVSITAAAITAGTDGIDADSVAASSTMRITANGDINAMAGQGIDAVHPGSGNLSILLAEGATITTAGGIGYGIRARTSDHDDGTASTSGMTITANGAIGTAANPTGSNGIHATHANKGDLIIEAGVIHATGLGINASAGDAARNTRITVNGAISAAGSQAINVNHRGSGDLVVSLFAAIDNTATTNPFAINLINGPTPASHRVIFNTGAGIDSGDGVSSNGSSTATLEFAAADGEDTASFPLADLANFAGFSVFEKTGEGTWAFTGAQPDDKAFTSATFTAGTLRLNAATFRPGSAAFAIPAAATLEITGASTIHAPLTNSGTLEITGSTASPTNATIMGDVTNSGTLDLDTATLTLGDNTLTNSGTLNVTGTSTITGALTNSGSVFLNAANLTLGSMSAPGTLAVADALNVTGNSSITGNLDNSATGAAISLAMSEEVAINTLTVSGTFTAGGSITLDMDLTGDTPDADELILSGSATGSDMVTLNLRIAADANLDLTADTPPVAGDMSDPRNLQPVSGSGASGVTFADAGTCTIIGDNSNASCTFAIDPDGTLTALQVAITADTGGAQAAVVESYTASLADIAALSGLASRTANRHYANGNRRGFWAQIAAGQTDTTPSFSSTGSSRDTGITRARFGLDAPLPLADLPLENLAIGANFWLAQTDSDITSRNGKGNIETDAFGFAASATLEHSINSGSMYADAQLQHATFSSDLKAAGETVQSNHDATSWGAALELGYKLPPAFQGISFTPQAQLLWSSVDFDAFTDAADERIAIADGETLTARLGIAAESSLNLAGFGGAGGTGATAGSFRAALDVLLPLDGETATNLGESRLISDMQDPALSLTAGGVFPLNATTTLAADLATTQSDEVETYRASLSARFAF